MILQDKNNVVSGSLYDLKKINSSRTTIELIDEKVLKKTFYDGFNFDKRWLDNYKKLRSWDSRYVEIYEIGKNFITMEYINPSYHLEYIFRTNNTNHTDEQKIYYISEYLDIIASSHSYISHNLNNIFVHTDLNMFNILVTENNKLVIIDPNACSYSPRFDRALPDLVSRDCKMFHRYYNLLQKKVNNNDF